MSDSRGGSRVRKDVNLESFLDFAVKVWEVL